MRFKWTGKTKRRWQIWEGFDRLLELLAQVDGPIINMQWFTDELETVGELQLGDKFIELYNSGKKYANPKHSSLAYFLGITDQAPTGPPVDMKMSQGRRTMPDIDLDFEDRYRDEVVQYTRKKYGYERTAQIATFGEMGAKKAVRDVCRVLDLPLELGDRLSKAMPGAIFGVAPTLERCMESAEFRNIYESEEEAKLVVDTAKKLEGLWRNTGVHAAGLLIADAPITDYVPVMQFGDDKPIVTQWDMKRTEQQGLLKIDFLGLRNLSIISRCIENIKETQGIEFDNPYKLVDDPDPEAYEMLQRGKNIGVFQMESGVFKDTMISLKPTDINDLSALVALVRPGPMGSNVHNEYADRKNGRKPVRYAHESLKPILKDTFGLMVYQEQLLSIAKNVAGKDTFEADELRQIVGKKQVDKMPAQRASFVQGCIDTVNMSRRDAETLFDEIQHHADYSFNKAHSVSYGFIAYVTAFFKAKYPIEYMAAALSASFNNADRLRLYLNECRTLGIKVKRPSLNHSTHDFRIVDNEIVYGFDGMKGFGGSIIDTILESRDDDNTYRNMFDFMRRAAPAVLNRKILLHLIKSGAMDELFVMPEYTMEMTRNDRIAMLFDELQQVGVFLVDHPFLDLKDLVVDKVSHTIDSITPESADSWVKVAGIITSVTKRTTKAGKRMFSLTIEDDTNSIEVVIFPAAAEGLSDDNPLVAGELLVIEGKVRLEGKSDDSFEPVIIYKEAEKIDYAGISTDRPIFLRPKKELTMSRLQQIQDIINASHGTSSVIIELTLDSGRKMMFKFNKTVASTVETTLQKLTEI